jgi:hypothetical protein
MTSASTRIRAPTRVGANVTSAGAVMFEKR